MKFKFSNSSFAPERFRPELTITNDEGEAGGPGGASDPEEASNTVNAGDPSTSSGGEDVSGLKNALEAERKGRKELDRQLKQLQEMFKGVDPAKYKELEALQAQAEEWNQRETSLTKQLEEEWTAKVGAEQTKSREWEGKYNQLLTRTLAEQAYQTCKGRSGAGDDGVTFFDAFLSAVKGSLRLNTLTGQIEVINNQGARLFSKKDATKPMQAAEYFEGLTKHPVFGHYFDRQSDGRGGGMTPNTLNALEPVDMSKLSRAQRLAMSRQQDH